MAVGRRRVARAEVPTEDAGGADKEDGASIEDDGLEVRLCWDWAGCYNAASASSRGVIQQRRDRRKMGTVNRQKAFSKRTLRVTRPAPFEIGYAGPLHLDSISVSIRIRRAVGQRPALRKQRRLLTRLAFFIRLSHWLLEVISQRETLVPEALEQQHNISERVVHSQDDHGGQYTLQHCADDVEKVAQKPYYDENDREAFCRASLPIFNDLR